MTNISFCRYCGKKIPTHYRSDTLFCEDSCRKSHWDILNRPNSNKKAFMKVIAVVGFSPQENVNTSEPEITLIRVYKY